MISLTGKHQLMLVIKGIFFFHSDLKVLLVVAAPASLECFTFFLLGLGDSAIFKLCLENFSKDSYISKNVASKNKANYNISSCFLYRKKKIFKKLLKSILQNFFVKWCASLIEALQHRHF